MEGLRMTVDHGDRLTRAAQSRFFDIIQNLCGSLEAVIDDQAQREIWTYQKRDDAKVLLGDLLRHLRNWDGDDRPFTRQLAEWKILNNHLLPMLATYINEDDLVLAILRLLFYVTSQPIDNPPNPLEQQRMLQSFKEAFLGKDVIASLVTAMTKPFADLTDNNNYTLVRLVLNTFRNLTMIPDPPPNPSSASDLSNMQHRLVEEFQKEFVFDLVIQVAAKTKDETRSTAVDILQMIYYLFRRERPEDLVSAARTAQSSGPSISSTGTKKADKKPKGRHPLFGGTFKLTTLSGAEVIKSNVKNVLQAELETSPLSPGARKKVTPGDSLDVTTPLHVKLILYKFANDLLASCYNELMFAVQLDLDPLSQEYDEGYWRYYLWAIKFFFQFQYLIQKSALEEEKKAVVRTVFLDVAPLASVLEIKRLREILAQVENYRLHKNPVGLEYGIGAVKEVLKMLVAMLRYGDETIAAYGRKLTAELFYETDQLLEPLVQLLRAYSRRQTLEYLGSCVEAIHACFSLFETEQNMIIVKKKRTGGSTMTAADERDLVAEGDEELENEQAEKEKEQEAMESRWRQERVYRLDDYVKRFTSPTIIELYLTLLSNYRENDPKVNHAVAVMFKRIAKDLDLYSMFFHIQTMRVFNDIIQNTQKNSEFSELRDLGLWITKKYFAQQKEKGVGPMTIELFFRKYRRDAVDLDIPDKEPEDGEYNPDHPERRDEELLDTRLEEESSASDFDLNEQLTTQRENAEKASETAETQPATPQLSGRGAVIQARRSAISSIKKKAAATAPKKKKTVKKIQVVEKRLVKKLKGCEPRTWSVSEDKELLDAFDTQYDLFKATGNPLTDELIIETTVLMQVYVRPGQAFVRLRELGRLTPEMLEKLTPYFEVEEEEEIVTTKEVEVEEEEDGDEAVEPAPSTRAAKKRTSRSRGKKKDKEKDIEKDMEEAKEHSDLEADEHIHSETPRKTVEEMAEEAMKKRREEAARAKAKALDLIRQKRSKGTVAESQDSAPLVVEESVPEAEGESQPEPEKKEKRRRLKKSNKRQARDDELLGDLGEDLELDDPMDIVLSDEEDEAEAQPSKPSADDLNSSKSIISPDVSFSADSTQKAASPRKSPRKKSAPSSSIGSPEETQKKAQSPPMSPVKSSKKSEEDAPESAAKETKRGRKPKKADSSPRRPRKGARTQAETRSDHDEEVEEKPKSRRSKKKRERPVEEPEGGEIEGSPKKKPRKDD